LCKGADVSQLELQCSGLNYSILCDVHGMNEAFLRSVVGPRLGMLELSCGDERCAVE